MATDSATDGRQRWVIVGLLCLGMIIAYQAPMQAIWFFLVVGALSYLVLMREKYAPRPNTTDCS